MPHFVTRIVFLALCFTSAVAAGPGLRVAVTPEEIRFAWTATGGEVEIREIPLHTSSDPQRDGRVVWRGAAGTGAAGIARFDGARDRLHAKFALGADGEPQHVTDFSALTRRSHALGAVANKKGLNCVLGIEDAVALGCAQVNQNINLGALLDWQSAEPKMHFTFEGKRFGLHAPAVARLDAELGAAHAAGQRVTGILLFYANARTPRASPY
jgi:hypothetical protein